MVDLRKNHQQDTVYEYPLRLSQEKQQALLVSLLTKAQQLAIEPEWYNTITNSCSSSLLWHANQLREESIWWNWKVLLPAYSDEILYDLDLIDTDISLEELRKRSHL